MAGEFLRSHGIDIDAEMSRIQNESLNRPMAQSMIGDKLVTSTDILQNVSLPRKPRGTRWDVLIERGHITDIKAHDSHSASPTSASFVDGGGALLVPSLCHPHVHLDKAFLLQHPKYSYLQVQDGDFKEAMSVTSKAKSQFEHDDLLERGQRVVDESVEAGVTHMRAFVELDAGVGRKCLEAGVEIKEKAKERCVVSLCAFAQLPLFSSSPGDEDGDEIRSLMWQAAERQEVDAIGSTPYVEADRQKMEKNVEWMIDLSTEKDLFLDFHLDYHLDGYTTPLVWHVIKKVKEKKWAEKTNEKTIVLGHCTRLALLQPEELRKLRDEIGDLPIFFVGLPTSDLFMMRTEKGSRGTLNIPAMIRDHAFNACLGINNIGNAFTPHGSCDPLTLACNGVGVYQAGTERDTEILLESVSTRPRRAIGMDGGKQRRERKPDDDSLELRVEDQANLLLFGNEKEEWRTRKSVSEAVYLYDSSRGRRALMAGTWTNDK